MYIYYQSLVGIFCFIFSLFPWPLFDFKENLILIEKAIIRNKNGRSSSEQGFLIFCKFVQQGLGFRVTIQKRPQPIVFVTLIYSCDIIKSYGPKLAISTLFFFLRNIVRIVTLMWSNLSHLGGYLISFWVLHRVYVYDGSVFGFQKPSPSSSYPGFSGSQYPPPPHNGNFHKFKYM